ncbi:DUF3037 domain-containing protein [Dyadobacter luticola]|uniref:DUF3037 domain-containing protein n=1 Tax=Dyadobacter luticola TaxID=1979387 RepID=A0A5R9L1X7_9BACT|nr:DUF3037 domain-containing protein [Dyadobacter luticola]TLV02574.1 DUF3037 domain-containing protein [Dyadobacter luticola]
MPEKHLFEYAVIRVVPRVEREEFMNVGVILYCSSLNFLRVKTRLDETRLSAFSPAIDFTEVQHYLRALEQVCQGRKEGGTIGALPVSSRFRWLTATRSTVIQASKVHAGFCEDPDLTLAALFNQQVS